MTPTPATTTSPAAADVTVPCLADDRLFVLLRAPFFGFFVGFTALSSSLAAAGAFVALVAFGFYESIQKAVGKAAPVDGSEI